MFIRISLLLLLSFLISCSSKKVILENTSNKTPIFYSADSTSITTTKCITVSNNQFCIPVDWFEINSEKYLHFSYTNQEDVNSYFVVLQHDKNQNYTIETHMRDLYNNVLSDTVEVLENYTLTELTINDSAKGYIIECWFKKYDNEYYARSIILEKEKYVYDITLKLKNDPDMYNNYMVLFRDLLLNMEVKEKALVNVSDSWVAKSGHLKLESFK